MRLETEPSRFVPKLLLIITAIICSTQAVLQVTKFDSVVHVGESHDVTYCCGLTSDAITIQLTMGADPNNLANISTLTTDAPGPDGTFTWDVDRSLVSGNDYYIRVIQDENKAYSNYIQVINDGPPVSSVISSVQPSATSISSAALPSFFSTPPLSIASSVLTTTILSSLISAATSIGVPSQATTTPSTSTFKTSSRQIPSSTTLAGSSSATAQPTSSGLPTGAKAAIGIIVPLAVIALVFILFIFRKRRTSGAQAANRDEPEWKGPIAVARHSLDKPELDGNATERHSAPYELDSTMNRPRVDAQGGLEAYTSPVPAELSANPTIRRKSAPWSADSFSIPMHSDNESEQANRQPTIPLPASQPESNLEEDVTQPSSVPETATLASEMSRMHNDELEKLKEQKARISREREEIEKLRRLREEERRLDEEIHKAEQR